MQTIMRCAACDVPLSEREPAHDTCGRCVSRAKHHIWRLAIAFALGMLYVSLTGCATWAPRDRALGGLAGGLITADAATTIAALRYEEVYETNPLLGSRPSDARVIVTCALAYAAVLLVGDRLPEKIRPWWLVAINLVETHAVVTNARVIRESQAARRVPGWAP